MNKLSMTIARAIIVGPSMLTSISLNLCSSETFKGTDYAAKNQDHPVQIHQTASEIVCQQCMRHSPAFDVVAEARGGSSNSISGVDCCRDFRFILHLFLGWMSLLADNYQR
jgi:hypothetical protein